MPSLSSYAGKSENVAMTRDAAGVLEVTLHTRGGPLKWSVEAHRDLGFAFADIAADRENRVVILTGAGEEFCTQMEWDAAKHGLTDVATRWDHLFWEARHMLENLMNIAVPVIGAVNGPAHIHAEIVALSDVVLMAEHASFRDSAHMLHGVVPGDGVHVFWPLVLGPNRGRAFLLTGQTISASEAVALGIAAEVTAKAALLPKAREIAASLAASPTYALRYTRIALTQGIKRRFLEELGYGLTLEALGEVARSHGVGLPPK